ncbi:MAG: hypothetical protein ABIP61_12105 [Burkholderiaceae bacterium]
MNTTNPPFTSTDTSLGDAPLHAPAIERAAQGAHAVVDRLANTAGPAVERLRSSVSGAIESAQGTARDAAMTGGAWVESSRASVREHPMTALAIAAAAGVLLSRLLSRR